MFNLKVRIWGPVYGHPTFPGTVAPMGEDEFTFSHTGPAGSMAPWVGLAQAFRVWANTPTQFGNYDKPRRSFFNPAITIEGRFPRFHGRLSGYVGHDRAEKLEEYVRHLLDPTGGWFYVRSESNRERLSRSQIPKSNNKDGGELDGKSR